MTTQPGPEATAAYEVLRSQALGHSGTGGPALGLAIVFRQGLPGWLHLWAERLAIRPTATPPGTQQLPLPLAPELPLVLASMVLHASQGRPA